MCAFLKRLTHRIINCTIFLQKKRTYSYILYKIYTTVYGIGMGINILFHFYTPPTTATTTYTIVIIGG